MLSDKLNDQKRLAQNVGTLNSRARSVIEVRLSENPEAPDLWFKLGQLCRGMGDLNAAVSAYKKALSMNFKPELSGYLISFLSSANDYTPIPYPEKGDYIPCPFIREFDLLEQRDLDTLWEHFNASAINFKASAVGSSKTAETNKLQRQSLVLSGKQVAPIEALIKPQLRLLFEQASQRFDIKTPTSTKLETQVTSHTNGDYYRVHSDSGPTYTRLFSFVFYFCHQPQQFSGGQLQLLDTDTQNDHYNTNTTLVEPVHNSIIIFPSDYFHQVCPVVLEKNQQKYSRNSVNGWLSSVPAD